MNLFSKNILYFLLFLMKIIIQFPLHSHGCHEEERRALLNFKSALEDPSNRLSSWRDDNQHRNCCSWQGIGCSYDTLNVISINLRNSKLEKYIENIDTTCDPFPYEQDIKMVELNTGIPPPNTSLTGIFCPSLLKITHLEYLDLAFNDFQQIPYNFSTLTKLVHVDLSHSILSSSITTQFNNLSSLQYLDLSWNTYMYIQSTQWLRGLTNLQVLKLSGFDISNAISSSQHNNNFGEHIFHLSSLAYLDLSDCSIDSLDFLIHGLHNSSRISTLILKYNYLFSPAAQLANLTSLSTLDLSCCHIEAGSVPYLPQLKELDVSHNPDFHPDITRMFQHQWPKLQHLSVSYTNISRSIISISNAPMLVSLSASSCSIQGSLSSSIYNLSKLQSLDLSGNHITGSIHFLISNLRNLYVLDLSNNNFHGSIPVSSSNLRNLHSLDLSNNNIQGSIPDSICKALSLRKFVLDNNNMTGTIPTCLTKFHKLEIFSVSQNSFEGTVSLINFMNEMKLKTLNLGSNRLTVIVDQHFHVYSNFFKMERLVLKSCNIVGLFPSFICGMTKLSALDLSHNNMTGPIPSCVSKLKISTIFDLSYNKFSGPLVFPPRLGSYYSLYLSHNNFSGTISIGTGKRLSRFISITLAGNQLSGSIPFSICSNDSLSHLNTLDLSQNKLSGVIPTSIGYCKGLFYLNLGSNNLTGNIPNELRYASELNAILLNDNNLNGTPPLKIISKFYQLRFLNLANNHFRGSIPTEFGSFDKISMLSLRSNMFNGSIPREIFNSKQLQILDLSRNNFSGRIPKISGMCLRESHTSCGEFHKGYDIELQMMVNGIMLQFERITNYSSGIDLSHNMLDGSIPAEISLLNKLAMLNLSHNHLSGIIPAGIGNMSSLGTLDLSFNRLSGHIPQFLTSLDFLGFLNLSYNEFTGRIPTGNHFDTLSIDGSAFIGNNLLCGEPLKKICDGDQLVNSSDTNPINNVEEGDQDDVKERIFFFGIITLGFVVGFWGLFLVLLLNKVKWWFPYWRFIDLVAVKITNKLYMWSDAH